MEPKSKLYHLIKRNTEFGNMETNLYRKIFFSRGHTNSPIEFSPEPDITAYELALLLPLLTGKNRSIKEIKDKLDLMPVEIKRHLK